MTHTLAETPLGVLIVAGTADGVTAAAFADSAAEAEALHHARFPRSERGTGAVVGWCAAIADEVTSGRPATVPVAATGTPFQRRVWAWLATIPRGETSTYAAGAVALGSPTAVRAVAGAVAANPAGVVVPCHRVVGTDGRLRGYRWGVERKAALLKLERGA